MRYNDPMEKSRFGWMSSVALFTAVIAVRLVTLAGPGYRAGWVGLATALQRMIVLGVFAGVGAVVLGLPALMINRGRARMLAAVAVMLGAVAAAVPLRLVQAGQAVPPIHDITRYGHPAAVRRGRNASAIVGLPNSLDYSDDVAAQQRTGYPEIQPVFLA